ncbi:MAG TPA: hypothetical protein GX707_07420 [Epulopiscium sp.]|nr:hypothetical protein [Candidatus Epulonipiscium sp.]
MGHTIIRNNIICKGLEYRTIEKGEDIDYFIETLSYPINFNIEIPHISRVQFPKSRAILLRTSQASELVTIHIMKDIDLHSSFCNFEVDLKNLTLTIKKNINSVEVCIQ